MEGVGGDVRDMRDGVRGVREDRINASLGIAYEMCFYGFEMFFTDLYDFEYHIEYHFKYHIIFDFTSKHPSIKIHYIISSHIIS